MDTKATTQTRARPTRATFHLIARVSYGYSKDSSGTRTPRKCLRQLLTEVMKLLISILGKATGYLTLVVVLIAAVLHYLDYSDPGAFTG